MPLGHITGCTEAPTLRHVNSNSPCQWEMANFDSLQNRNPWRQQNSAQLVTSTRVPPNPNFVQIHPLGASGQIGKI